MAINLFDKNITLLQKSMEFRVKRNDMIASNLANRETPGFRAQDLVFEKQLGKAMHADEPGPLNTNNPRHFDGAQREPLALVQGQQINSYNPDPRMDGNTVNLDKEMAKLAENQLLFQAATKAVNWKFRMIKNAITEGGR